MKLLKISKEKINIFIEIDKDYIDKIICLSLSMRRKYWCLGYSPLPGNKVATCLEKNFPILILTIHDKECLLSAKLYEAIEKYLIENSDRIYQIFTNPTADDADAMLQMAIFNEVKYHL